MKRRDSLPSPRPEPDTADEVDLPVIETGDDAADRIYRRLIARRRRWVHGDLVVEDDSGRPDPGPVRETGQQRQADDSSRRERRNGNGGDGGDGVPRTARTDRPVDSPAAGPSAFGHRSAAASASTAATASTPDATARSTQRPSGEPTRGDAASAPLHRASVFAPSSDPGAGEDRGADGRRPDPAYRAGDHATRGPQAAGTAASGGASDRAHRGSRNSPSGRTGPDTGRRFSEGTGTAGTGAAGTGAAGTGTGTGTGTGEEFSLDRWQPRSHTVRFIKEHPALAAAIGVPALLLLTRPGMAARTLRYATSPAGLATIQRLSTVATALGLLERSRR